MKYTGEDIAKAMNIPFLPDQLKAISAPLAPGVVIAGAGSGKTTVMAARVVFLVANDMVKPEEVLGLTFTRLAAGELAAGIRKALAKLNIQPTEAAVETHSDTGEPTVSTYDAFSNRLIKEHGLLIGVEPDSLIVTDVRRQQLAARLLQKTQLPLAAADMAFMTAVERTLKLDDALANYDVTIADLRAFDEQLIRDLEVATKATNKQNIEVIDTSHERILLGELVAEFRELKHLSDALDYADMSRLTLQLVRLHPQVIEAAKEQFKVVLLDEFQDTSVAQRKLMQLLFGSGGAVTAVGDALQSIYTFRGASVWNIDDFPTQFPQVDNHESPVFGLPVTQRNGKNIVALANRITEDLRAPGVHDKVGALVAREDPKHGPGRIRIASFEHAEDEAKWVAQHLRDAHAEGIAFDDMALLLRNNDQVAWMFSAMTALGIPCQVRSKRTLLSVPEVAEVIAMLRVIAEPTANAAWVRILSGPRWRIGDRDLALIGRKANELAFRQRATGERKLEETLADAVAGTDPVDVVAFGDAIDTIAMSGLEGLSADATERVRTLAAEIRNLRSHASDDLVDFVHRVAVTTGLLAESGAHTFRVHGGFGTNLRSFFSLVANFTSIDGDKNLFSFLDWLRDGDRFGAESELAPVLHKGAVHLMTSHSAKGLEYRVVGLPRFAEGVFPSSNGHDRWPTISHVVPARLRDEKTHPVLLAYPDRANGVDTKTYNAYKEACTQIDELDERRLAYVAVTRSADILLASSSSVMPGDKQFRLASKFLVELREVAADLIAQGRPDISIEPWQEIAEGEKPSEVPGVSGVWPVQLTSDVMQEITASAQRVLDLISQKSVADSVSDIAGKWDEAIAAIETELTAGLTTQRTVEMPVSLSVTQVQNFAKNADDFVSELLRPMPRPPAPAASQGTAFHNWVEARAVALGGSGLQIALPGFDDDEFDLEGTMDSATLQKFRDTFELSEWGRTAAAKIEEPFAIRLAGRLIRGRIDAIYSRVQDGRTIWTLVDWKTNRAATADPLQLSIYRLAWAQAQGCALEDVEAAFYYVALDQTVKPEKLLSLAEVEALLQAPTT